MLNLEGLVYIARSCALQLPDLLGVRYTYDFTPGEFPPVPGQSYLSVYMFNRGEILLLLLFRNCLENRGKTHPGDNSARF